MCGCIEGNPGPCTRSRAPLRPHCDCREAFKDPRGRHKKLCRFYRDRDRSKTKVQPKFEIRRLGKSLYQCSCRALHLDNRGRHNLKCCFYVQRAKASNKGKSARRTKSRRARPNSTRRAGPRPPPRSRGRGGDDLTVDGNIERNPGPSSEHLGVLDRRSGGGETIHRVSPAVALSALEGRQGSHCRAGTATRTRTRAVGGTSPPTRDPLARGDPIRG